MFICLTDKIYSVYINKNRSHFRTLNAAKDFGFILDIYCGNAARQSPKLIEIASFTLLMDSSPICPIRSLRRCLSIVLTCSSNTTESRSSPQCAADSGMWVGRRALPVCDVIAAAITVGLYLLPTSFCTIRTGRIPPCSEPTTGLRSA